MTKTRSAGASQQTNQAAMHLTPSAPGHRTIAQASAIPPGPDRPPAWQAPISDMVMRLETS
jgi:hypothetical protein